MIPAVPLLWILSTLPQVPQSAPAGASSCPQHWAYHPPSGFLAPPMAADTQGTLVWREGWNSTDLVAVRDRVPRWRKRVTPHAGFPVNTMVLDDRLLVQAFGSTVEARRMADGSLAWTHDLTVHHQPMRISAIARLGRLIVAASAASDTSGWLTALRRNGRIAWRTHIAGAVARLAATNGQLSLLMSVTRAGDAPPGAVDTTGKRVDEVILPRIMGRAVLGDEVVFDSAYAVVAEIAPLPFNCPPQSPSCHPPPEMLTVAGYSAAGTNELWHFTGPPHGLHVQLLLLDDSSALLVDSSGVSRVSHEGTASTVCALALSGHWSVAGLFRGDLVIASRDTVVAYALPGAPRLATRGWVMRGGGPAQDWAAR